jgi:hypothetical protein
MDSALMGRLLGDAIHRERIKRIRDVMSSLEVV